MTLIVTSSNSHSKQPFGGGFSTTPRMRLLLVSFLLLTATPIFFKINVASAVPLGEVQKRCEDIPNAITVSSAPSLCVCMDGYTGPATFSPDSLDAICVDVDECKEGSAKCHDIAACKNQIGFYECYCPHGYTGIGIGNNGCSDVNECQNPMICGHDSICKNFVPSYECIKCDEGHYNLDGFCQDRNECLNVTFCGTNAICQNTIGSYQCIPCDQGYRNVNGECEDIDECSTDIADCHETATCINKRGFYYCLCPPGFTGNGDRQNGCQDIDECRHNPCTNGSECLNYAGSFQCYCVQGYSYDKATQTCKASEYSQVHDDDMFV